MALPIITAGRPLWRRSRQPGWGGVVEGFNGKTKLTTRNAFGFRTTTCIRIALFQLRGRLPESEFTHGFYCGGFVESLAVRDFPVYAEGAEAGANLAQLRSRLTEANLAQLTSLCAITGGQTSFTRPDGVHVIALGHLRP